MALTTPFISQTPPLTPLSNYVAKKYFGPRPTKISDVCLANALHFPHAIPYSHKFAQVFRPQYNPHRAVIVFGWWKKGGLSCRRQ